MGFCLRMNTLWRCEVGCWGIPGAVRFRGQWGERGEGSLLGCAAVPLLLPESCGGTGKVKGGWYFSFSFTFLLFPLTVPGSRSLKIGFCRPVCGKRQMPNLSSLQKSVLIMRGILYGCLKNSSELSRALSSGFSSKFLPVFRFYYFLSLARQSHKVKPSFLMK